MTVHNHKAYRLLGMFLLWTFAISNSLAQEQKQAGNLTISPKQCVALNQGNTCYIDVDVSWQTDLSDDYCLYVDDIEKPLICWEQASQGEYQLDLSSKQNIVISLKSKTTDRQVASAELEIAWVYKKNNRRHSSWRMF
jgi:hypothetical protein